MFFKFLYAMSEYFEWAALRVSLRKSSYSCWFLSDFTIGLTLIENMQNKQSLEWRFH